MTRRKTRLLPGLAIAVVTLGLLGAVTYVFFWNPTPSFEAAPDEAASQISSDELAKAAELRVFFGHMSVGQNIMSGLDHVYAARGVQPPEVVEINPGEVPGLPGDAGALVHALIGENGHPNWKLQNFDATLRAGLAGKVDVAVLKFCYVDVRWNTDVDALFREYQKTMDALQQDFPDVLIMHTTVPLTTGPHGIKDHLKLLLGRDDNAAREKYNALMRSAYGPDELLDVAAIESTAPDGSTSAELYPGYSLDGEHLNDTGSALVAVEWVRHLSRSGR